MANNILINEENGLSLNIRNALLTCTKYYIVYIYRHPPTKTSFVGLRSLTEPPKFFNGKSCYYPAISISVHGINSLPQFLNG